MDEPRRADLCLLAGVPRCTAITARPTAAGRSSPTTLNRAGPVAPAGDPAAAGRRPGHYEAATGHNIPDVFWHFMTPSGPVTRAARCSSGLVDPLVYPTLGYPITEPYWVRCRVAGRTTGALVQAFQRRVLTYTPDNAPAWQVEMGNVGRHYYDWRYGAGSPYEEQRGERDDH